MCRMCVRTVVSAMDSADAISAFDCPRPINVRTVRSAGVSDSSSRASSGTGAPSPTNVSTQAASDRGRQERVAVGHDPDGVDELLGPDVLEQEAARTGAERLHHVLVDVEGRQDQDLRGVVLRREDPRGLNAVEPGHADVHQDHVGMEPPGLFDRLLPVSRFAHQVDVRLGAQGHLERRPHQRLVVGDQDPDGHVDPR